MSTAAVVWEAAGGLVAEALAGAVDVPAGSPAGGFGDEHGDASAGGPDAPGALDVTAGGSAHGLLVRLGNVVVCEPAEADENAGVAVYGTSSWYRSAGVPDAAAGPAAPGELAGLGEPAGLAGQTVVAEAVAVVMADGSGEAGGGRGALGVPGASGAQQNVLLGVLPGAPAESDEAVVRAGPAEPAEPAEPVGRTAVPAATPAEAWGAGS